ncbi:MAG TPA: hypothetical protein VJB59_14955 [Bdellovibrionota bacterium]|nr:hypothetical protein [Bdellovibrionota bacterium]
MVSDFVGAGVSIAKKIGYAGGDDFASWEFANVYDQIGADEEMSREFPRMGKIKTVIGVTGYPELIRPVFARSYLALKGKDADHVIRGKIKSRKKVEAGFRGIYASGERFDADLECSPVTDHEQIRNKMFNAIGGVERMIRGSK